MNIDEAFAFVHNLGVRDALRRFQPKYSILVVSKDGQIVATEKHKTTPEFCVISMLLKRNKGCGAFVASAEMYPTKDELQQRVLSLASKLRNRGG